MKYSVRIFCTASAIIEVEADDPTQAAAKAHESSALLDATKAGEADFDEWAFEVAALNDEGEEIGPDVCVDYEEMEDARTKSFSK